MHEMSLCESVVQILVASAKEQCFTTVKTVWLEIGVLSCVEPEAMHFSFDVVTRGTLAEGAKLVIERVPATARCLSCHQDVTVHQYGDPCPACGGSDLQISGGDQLRVKELEVV